MRKFNFLADPCLSCGLWKDKKNPCIRPKVIYKGALTFVGEAPGGEEDYAGEAFVGPAGKVLRQVLAAPEIPKPYNLVNAVACRPVKGNANRAPTAREIEACRIFLQDVLSEIQPPVVVALGKSAARALGLPADLVMNKLRYTAWESDIVSGKAPVFVTYHPAAHMRPGKQQLLHDLEVDIRSYLCKKSLTNEEECGSLYTEGEEAPSELCLDIETDGFLKDKRVLPYDKDGRIILIGTNRGTEDLLGGCTAD